MRRRTGSSALGLAACVAIAALLPGAAFACDARHRTLELDPGQNVGGSTPGYAALDLRDREVVLTFDDGPNPETTPRILDILSKACVPATFFVLGWIAERYPELVRQISNAGHEIASRGFLHQPLLKVTAKARREDLIRSKELLEDTIGKEVVGFRLSDGWLRKRDLGFLNELQEAGYVYDSSLMPRRRDFLMQPWRRFIHEHKCDNGGSILEIPPSTTPMAVRPLR